MATSAKSATAAPSKTKLTWTAALSIPTIPALALGLTDPLEGLPLLAGGIALLVVVRVLSRVRMPKLASISLGISFAMIAGMMLILLLASDPSSVMVENADAKNVAAFSVLMMMWPQRISTIVMAAGLIVYTVRLFRVRAGKPAFKISAKKAAK